jgi:hypothetical protein
MELLVFWTHSYTPEGSMKWYREGISSVSVCTTFASLVFFFFFGGAGVLTEDFTLAKQALYCFSHTSGPSPVFL